MSDIVFDTMSAIVFDAISGVKKLPNIVATCNHLPNFSKKAFIWKLSLKHLRCYEMKLTKTVWLKLPLMTPRYGPFAKVT